MFTPAQQSKYRPLVQAAWKAYTEASGIDPKDKPAREAWYESELKTAIGMKSTVSADPGFDFDLAMAHFEGLADAGFHWRGGLRKSIFERIKRVSKHPSATPEYCESIIRQARRLNYTPKLETLHKNDFITIIRGLKLDRARR